MSPLTMPKLFPGEGPDNINNKTFAVGELPGFGDPFVDCEFNANPDNPNIEPRIDPTFLFQPELLVEDNGLAVVDGHVEGDADSPHPVDTKCDGPDDGVPKLDKYEEGNPS